MTAEGTLRTRTRTRTRSRRALRSGDAILVRLIYDELRSPTIDEKLMFAVTVSRAGDRRASRFLARWHAAYAARWKLSLEQTAALLHALRLLPDTDPLEDTLDQMGETRCLAELRWLTRGRE